MTGVGDLGLAAVAAVAECGTIGHDGEMPWHHPEDLERFRDLTDGHPVVMGRTTHESIVDRLGHPLPGRTTVVLTSRPFVSGVTVAAARSVEHALELAAEDADARGVSTAFVAGGASVYGQMLPLCDRLHLTRVHATYEGDTRFPDWDPAEWREASSERGDGITFYEYERLYRGIGG